MKQLFTFKIKTLDLPKKKSCDKNTYLFWQGWAAFDAAQSWTPMIAV